MKATIAGIMLLVLATLAHAETRSVLLIVRQDKDKSFKVAIHSDEKKERREAASFDEACGVVQEMKGWGSVVHVFVVSERSLPRQHLNRLLDAVADNGWLNLAYLRQGLSKELAEHFIKTRGAEDRRPDGGPPDGGGAQARSQDTDKPGAATTRPLHVSLIQLIANPDAYHGKHVRVQGFVRIEHEGTAVYLHREDFERSLTKNGLWLAANDATPEGSREAQVNNRYAIIEGRFNANSKGHLGLWSGSIENITRMQPWAIRNIP